MPTKPPKTTGTTFSEPVTTTNAPLREMAEIVGVENAGDSGFAELIDQIAEHLTTAAHLRRMAHASQKAHAETLARIGAAARTLGAALRDLDQACWDPLDERISNDPECPDIDPVDLVDSDGPNPKLLKGLDALARAAERKKSSGASAGAQIAAPATSEIATRWPR